MFVLAVFAYSGTGSSWTMFALLFLLPDLSMLGFLAGPRPGAHLYNLVHSYSTPAALAIAQYFVNNHLPSALWLIWVAHIAFDRVLGYGLKLPDGFTHTHLGRIGRAKLPANVM